jgi:hypothetical protein
MAALPTLVGVGLLDRELGHMETAAPLNPRPKNSKRGNPPEDDRRPDTTGFEQLVRVIALEVWMCTRARI